LDDGNLPLLPDWETQIQQLPEVPDEGSPSSSDTEAE